MKRFTINMFELEKHFNFYSEIAGIAENILMRATDDVDLLLDDVTDALLCAADEELIYTADQWEIMKYYQNPREADFNRAFDALIEDLIEAINNGVLIENEEA